MKLTKLPHQPGALLEFFEEGLASMGALCERSWHDGLQVVAEGRAARLWNPTGELVEREIRFPEPGQNTPRQAETEVFPGCPLLTHLAEAMRGECSTLRRVVLQAEGRSHAPAADVAERLWRLQFPETSRWRLDTTFAADWCFALVALARCEIQAIDQHWSLHRLAVSLPSGERDEGLAQGLAMQTVRSQPGHAPVWPDADVSGWQAHLQRALEAELENDLAGIRARQEQYLRRELERIDDYFEHYAKELTDRARRSRSPEMKSKLAARLQATRTEHERRRLDQVHRHEIRVVPQLDALIVLAEPAWRVTLTVSHHGVPLPCEAVWVPRTRRWRLVRQA